MPKLDLKECQLYIAGVEVKIGTGSISWSEKKPRTYEKDRWVLDTVRNADEEPVDVKFSFSWEWLKNVDSGTVSPVDLIKGNGYTSSDADPCAPYACDIKIKRTVTCGTGSGATTKSEYYLLSDFRYENLNFDTAAGQLDCDGKCNVTQTALSSTDPGSGS